MIYLILVVPFVLTIGGAIMASHARHRVTRPALVLCACLALAGCSIVRQIEVHADVSEQVSGNFRYSAYGHDYGPGHLARIEIEAPIYQQGGVRIFGSVTHESLLDTNRDRGEERMHIGISWRPFN